MSKIKGIDFLLYANKGTDLLPEYEVVGGQRGATLNRSADTLETTAKDSDGWKEFETSFIEWSIEAEGIFVSGDEGFNKLEESFFSREKILVEMKTASGRKYSGNVIVTDLPLEMPYDDMMTYSVTLQGSGELVQADS